MGWKNQHDIVDLSMTQLLNLDHAKFETTRKPMQMDTANDLTVDVGSGRSHKEDSKEDGKEEHEPNTNNTAKADPKHHRHRQRKPQPPLRYWS